MDMIWLIIYDGFCLRNLVVEAGVIILSKAAFLFCIFEIKFIHFDSIRNFKVKFYNKHVIFIKFFN